MRILPIIFFMKQRLISKYIGIYSLNTHQLCWDGLENVWYDSYDNQHGTDNHHDLRIWSNRFVKQEDSDRNSSGIDHLIPSNSLVLFVVFAVVSLMMLHDCQSNRLDCHDSLIDTRQSMIFYLDPIQWCLYYMANLLVLLPTLDRHWYLKEKRKLI